MAKQETMNGGVYVIDLVFIRVFINFLISIVLVKYNNKHIINDMPKRYRKMITFRSMFGLIAFSIFVYGIKIVPLFLATIVLNTSPFVSSIMAYFFLGDKISKIEIFLMTGCFSGVATIAL